MFKTVGGQGEDGGDSQEGGGKGSHRSKAGGTKGDQKGDGKGGKGKGKKEEGMSMIYATEVKISVKENM